MFKTIPDVIEQWLIPQVLLDVLNSNWEGRK